VISSAYNDADMKRFDVFLSDGHRLTTNEDGYNAIRRGMAGENEARLVRVGTVRGDRIAHSIELNVDHVVTICSFED
jgi:hypothetical protein